MRIFFDTEFIENGKTIDLISIGMVNEAGESLYLENADCARGEASDWVKDNVFPQLRGPLVSRSHIASSVRSFAGPNPEFWAYYADYDWVVLCQLYGTMMDLPEGWPMYCRVVVALRERQGRVLPFVTRSEGEGVALVNENVDRMATLPADEASHWDLLHAGLDVERVNHSEIYSDHGKHTNMVESYFSRLRRMVVGQHHHVSPQYLHQYANHAAWMEDNRRTDNGTLAHALVSNAMGARVSRNWKGYWQRAA